MIPAKINKILDSMYEGLDEHRLNDEWLKGYRLGLSDAAIAVYQVSYDDGARDTARFQAGFLEAQKWWAEKYREVIKANGIPRGPIAEELDARVREIIREK